jgi:hypothetical protein
MVATPRRNHHDGRSAASVPTAERAAPALHSGGVDLAAAAAALLISPATALAWLATNRYGLCLCGVRERERESMLALSVRRISSVFQDLCGILAARSLILLSGA